MMILGGLDIRRDCGRNGDTGEAPDGWLCTSAHTKRSKAEGYQQRGGGLGDRR